MTYVAKKHIRVAGSVMRPGEVFEADFDAATLERLSALDAVDEVDPEATLAQNAAANEHAAADEDPEAETQEEAANTQDEAQSESPAPEIDAMDGVTAHAKKSTKTKKAGGKKK